ncbi:AN1-type zinc finger protein 4-like isoform X3 [Dermacentor albipictus]|uniref:AN1-type zinc finger protein 4-like isoform X3 n=1 Tax=Dermacentor albipictus TaxID=60249 RepID=UPI0031FBA6C5
MILDSASSRRKKKPKFKVGGASVPLTHSLLHQWVTFDGRRSEGGTCGERERVRSKPPRAIRRCYRPTAVTWKTTTMGNSDVIEVFIETLHGTAFELLVSPADTVVFVKSRISRLEGIPVSQQHLIWQCKELPDDSSLHECNITDGATIKLVLAMRGGPINTRRAYLDERPTLNDVVKYLDTKSEVILSVPRVRAVRLVVMRDGDKVHLYTVLDTAPRSPSGLLSEDNTPRELSDEDSASESCRHRENQITRQKLEQLQRKMRYCRLRKGVKPVFIDLAMEEGTKAITAAPKALLPPLEPPKAQPPAKRDDAVVQAPRPIMPRSSLPSSNVPGCGKKKAEKALGRTALPQLQTIPSGCSRITPRHWKSPSSLQSPRKHLLPSYFSSGGHVTHHLPAAVARAEASGALPKRTERTAAVLHSRAGVGFQGRCRKVLLLATLGPIGPSSSCCASLPEEDTACTAEPGRYYNVLPPVGRREQGGLPCLQPSQDLASAVASILEPLELDWGDCDRPQTAPPRFVRVSVMERAKATRPIVSLPCTPNKGHACNAKTLSEAQGPTMAGESALPTSLPTKPSSPTSVPSSPLPPSPKPSRPLSSATPPKMPLTAADACRHDMASARKPPPPSAGSAEGIRWALGDGGRRTAVLLPSRLCVAPLLKRVVQKELWKLEQEMNNSPSCWARVAADNDGDDQKTPRPNNTVPTSNGPSNGSPERSAGSSTDASGSAVTGASVAAMSAEGSSSAVSAAGSAGSMSAETSTSMTGTASGSGSNVVLSVDVGTLSSAELSAGNGGELLPIQLDDDSSSTSESKTDDMPVDPLNPSPGKAKKKGKRCSWCNKKTGLASTYVCRCGSTFCATHRYAEAHACSHDYKAEGRYILQRNNPVVKAAKLPKI